MPGLISRLIDVLNEQAEYYEQLHALSIEKKDVIIKNEIENLQKITDIENILVSKYQKLDRTRLTITNDIALVLNKNASELTLSALVVLMEGQPEYDDLTKVYNRLHSSINDLRASNEQNKLLIESSLDYIDYTMNVMRTSMEPEQSTYGRLDGEADQNAGFFDTTQ